MISIIQVFNLVKAPFFMPKLATFAIWAKSFLMELFAPLGFILIMNRVLLCDDFLVSMRKLALISVPAIALLDPILAHFCFKFGLIDLPLLQVLLLYLLFLLVLLSVLLFVLVLGL